MTPTATAVGDLFTIGEVAIRLAVPVWRIDSLIRQGLLVPARKVGPYRIFTSEGVGAARALLVEQGIECR